MLGLEIDEPIDSAIARLTARGVRMTGAVVRSEGGSFVHFEDPDGADIYLWEVVPGPAPQSEVEQASV